MRPTTVRLLVGPQARDLGSRQLFSSIALIVVLVAAWSTRAAEFKSIELSDKTTIRYALVLPDGFRQGQIYPFILALPPGQQDQAMV